MGLHKRFLEWNVGEAPWEIRQVLLLLSSGCAIPFSGEALVGEGEVVELVDGFQTTSTRTHRGASTPLLTHMYDHL